MTRILAFDSMYMVYPIRIFYAVLIKKILNGKKTTNSRLVLYRLDKDNVFIREKRNLSGIKIGVHRDQIDAMSIKFYRYLEKSGKCDHLLMKNVQLFKLYTRQVKLKLDGVLKCAFRLRSLLNETEGELEIITDRQTVSIMREAFLFLNYEPTNIVWKENDLLTSFVTINTLIMRFAAVSKMFISPCKLPREYLYKHVDSNAPTILITMPVRRPDDFFSTYVEEFSAKFNIILYSLGFLQNTPQNYKRIKIKRKIGLLRGIFNTKYIGWSLDSYIADILLIYKKHSNLSTTIDVVSALFSNKINAHINRQQTSVVDNYLAVEAKKKGVFILGDVFEEVYYCDSAVCSSKSQNTESLKLALNPRGKVVYKGSNSLIKYRLKSFSNKQDYLNKLFGIDLKKKIIFYASNPSKEESQRYLAEKFLIDYFSRLKDFVFVIKTHSQDNGRVTNYAYLDSGEPSNVILIGDITQKSKIVSKRFILFDEFDFNAAIISCDGFLTTSSSSILQALVLGIKAGIVDIFNNGSYDYLVKFKAIMLVNSEESLQYFLKSKKLNVSESALSYCGLNNKNEEFDVGEHLLECMDEFDRKKRN